MVQRLLLAEMVLKGALGLVLLIAPRLAARTAGLPADGAGLWLRLAGGLLLGIAGAILVEGLKGPGRGVPLSAIIAVNLGAAGGLAAALAVAPPATRRGTAVLWLAILLLLGLGFVEIAHA
jgi:hypothetical protein